MLSDALYHAVCRRTRARFGRAMSLHLFRDAAATFWAENEPGRISMVRDLLGHADHKTAEQHYIHAHTVRAARTLADLIAERKAQRA
jgi:integrase